MKKDLYVIITGGGVGRRMGGGIAKQFLMLEGKPILLKTIELFKKWREDVHIIIVLPSQYKEYWKQYCVENDLWFKHIIVSGGISRFHSVKNALKHVPDGAVVAVHDAVRPFVPEQMLEKLLDFKINVSPDNKTCGVIPVMPSIESMREKSFDADGRVTNTFTVNRDHYLFVQTPQVFDSTVLKKCYQKAYSPLFTDDASVVESGGYKVATVEGSRFNLKITTPEDLKMAEIIMNMNF